MVYLETLLIRGENMYKNYSVLMTVYYKENPTFFETAIESILNQTLKTNDFVIVADGPLGEPLEAVLRKYESNPIFTIVRTPENKGSGAASQAGLPYIKNEVFAKMDSDDISVPERMEKELAKINDGYDVVGGFIAEFIDDPQSIISIRKPPEQHDDIVKFSKKRNPISNVTIMYKKSKIESVGGYPDLKVLEDYTLDIKLIQSGCKVYNIQEVMVLVRSNKSQMKRRGDKYLRVKLKELRKYMVKTKYISKFEYFIYNIEASLFLLSPSWLKRLFYKIFLRRK